MHYFYTLNHVYLTLKCLSAINIKSLIYIPLATTQTVTALPCVIFTPLSVNTDLRLENSFQTITRAFSSHYHDGLSEIIIWRGGWNKIKIKKRLCSYFFGIVLPANQWKTMQTCLLGSVGRVRRGSRQNNATQQRPQNRFNIKEVFDLSPSPRAMSAIL